MTHHPIVGPSPMPTDAEGEPHEDQYLLDVKVVNDIALELSSLRTRDELFRVVTSSMHRRFEAMAVTFALYDYETRAMTIHHATGPEEVFSLIETHTGIDPRGTPMTLEGVPPEVLVAERVSRLDCWVEFSFGCYPPKNATALAEALQNGYLYGMTLVDGDTLLGALGLITHRGARLHSLEALQALANLVTATLKRISAEERSREVPRLTAEIQELERVQRELEASEERYRTLVELSPDSIVVTDTEGRLVMANKSAAALYGCDSVDQVLGRGLFEFFPPAELERATRSLQTLVEKGGTDTQEYEVMRQDGTTFTGEVSGVMILDDTGTFQGFLGIVRDISVRKALAMELRKSQRLESLGLLAGGIAHDFNNILTAVLGNISMARSIVGGDDEVDDILDEAGDAAAQMRGLTRQLLTFAKGERPLRKVTTLGPLVTKTVGLTARGSSVEVRFEGLDGLPHVEIDEAQIAQVLGNITLNAVQAMPGGGVFTVRGRVVEGADELPSTLREGRYVVVSFTDEGSGIRDEHLELVFDPYFTTKSQGSGLGLATAHSIVTKHDGALTASSAEGEGTTITLYLPESDAQHEPRDERSIRGEMRLGGRGVVLVMDDDDLVQHSSRRMLERLGYEVLSARSGEETLARYVRAMEEGTSIDVIIMDLTIQGGMGGKETMARLLEIDPEVVAIVSSGYSTDPVMGQYHDYGFQGVLAKPYRYDELAAVLERVIGAARR